MTRIKQSIVIVDGTRAKTYVDIFKIGSVFEVHVDQATHEIEFNILAIDKFNSYSDTGYKKPVNNTIGCASFMYQKFKTLKQAKTCYEDVLAWVGKKEYYKEHGN